jgi:hypothetical protein
VIVSKKRTRQDDEAMNELPLAVLKKLKAGPPVGGHLNQMEQRAFSVTSLQFAVPSSASTTPRPLAIAAKPPDSLQPSWCRMKFNNIFGANENKRDAKNNFEPEPFD